MILAVQMLIVNQEMTLPYVLVPQDMLVIHLIKDEDVKSNLAQLDLVAQMLNVLQTDELQFASAQEDTQVILTLTADLTLALLDPVPITPFVKTLETQLYASVLQPTLVILTSTADLTHVLNQLVVKILNVLQVDNDHCADVLEVLPEIQTVEQDVMLTLVQ